MENNTTREYITKTTNPHGLEEERQWHRILSTNPVNGMVVLFIQKMCSAFHEFEPAWKAGALDPQKLPFFRERLSGRISKVLETMRNNSMEGLDGYAYLEQLLEETRTAPDMDTLAELAEKVHAANHIITDSLEAVA